MATPQQHNYKPIPKTDKEIANEVDVTKLLTKPVKQFTKRELVIKCIHDTKQLNRSRSQAFIMLLGSSGVGKSSTINHLFSLNPQSRLKAATSDEESETKSVQEYIFRCNDSKYDIKDATLSVIDTPGFNDTDGIDQDACNMRAIKKFIDTHPAMKGKLPNLVFVCVKANDDRFKGPQSDFAKSLRCLKNSGVIDCKHSNVVGVITFACTITPSFKKSFEAWKTKIESKRTALRKIIGETLGIQDAPTIILENEFKEFDLMRPLTEKKTPSDYTRLPNGDLQPRNLFLACETTLQKLKDSLGEIIFNSCFLNDNNDLKMSKGLEVKAKIASDSVLDEEERKIVSWFNTLANTSKTNITAGKGVSLQDHKVKPQEKLSLLNKGFDILNGKETTAEIFQLDHYKDCGLGFQVPSNCNYETLNETKDIMEHFQSKKEFLKKRLHDFNVKVDINYKLLNFQTEFGFNQSSQVKREKSSVTFSFMREHRTNKVIIDNFTNLSLNREFELAVKSLPKNSSDENGKQMYKSFFDRFGHYAVTHVFVGGSVAGNVTNSLSKDETFESSKTRFYSSMGFCFSRAQLTDIRLTEEMKKNRQSLSVSQLQWRGGDSKFHSKETLDNSEASNKWRASINANPVVLKTEIGLQPIQIFIGLVCPEKQKPAEKAIEDLFNSKLKAIEDKENSRLKAIQDKENLKREDLTKKETVQKHATQHKSGGCFSLNSRVRIMKNGEVSLKKLRDLEIGDRILTRRHSNDDDIVYSKIVAFADYKLCERTEFLKLTVQQCCCEYAVSLLVTSNHLLFYVNGQTTAAGNVNIGDELIVLDYKNNRPVLKPTKIISIESVIENGCIAPITKEGNLFVDDVLASCYANVKDVHLFNKFKFSGHEIAHVAMYPLRLMNQHRLLKQSHNNKTTHPYIEWLTKLKLSKNRKHSILFE